MELPEPSDSNVTEDSLMTLIPRLRSKEHMLSVANEMLSEVRISFLPTSRTSHRFLRKAVMDELLQLVSEKLKKAETSSITEITPPNPMRRTGPIITINMQNVVTSSPVMDSKRHKLVWPKADWNEVMQKLGEVNDFLCNVQMIVDMHEEHHVKIKETYDNIKVACDEYKEVYDECKVFLLRMEKHLRNVERR